MFHTSLSVILKVMATQLVGVAPHSEQTGSAPGTDLMDVRRLFLSDMIKLFSSSRDNRR